MLVGVVGCCHGELDVIYDTLAEAEKRLDKKTDLLLICGDFQSVRNEDDLECVACPPKYRQINTFYKYYSGEKTAPVLTIFVGGNHEASNYLQELPYGGFVAPNIYYMGYAGAISVGGLRIAGISGIYKKHDYDAPHFEHPPYTESSLRSVYHMRKEDVERLCRISGHVDVFLSHDWPSQITQYGNLQKLLQRKRFLKEDIERNALGSPALDEIISRLQPSYFFAAHLHAKFPAIVPHGEGKETKFLALSKPLPGQDFLQVVEIDNGKLVQPDTTDAGMEVVRDLEWLAIMRNPKAESMEESLVKETLDAIGGMGGLKVEKSGFVRTARTYNAASPVRGRRPMALNENPQTVWLSEKLDLKVGTSSTQRNSGPAAASAPDGVGLDVQDEPNPEEIDIDLDDV
mmetsp:Transcript_42506/g.165912  ORF Transcript_42506/g.165912 Transcript_42506/m.165912 type:complete len:402 (-) Transcript_42506:1592-2797(-)